MITNVPTAEEYRKTGTDLLNLAWGQITDLSETLALSDTDSNAEENREKTQERHTLFWQAANQKVANCIVIVQQATEFLLTAKIAAVSPYLLIANDPRDWPKGNKTDNTIDFSHFRTLDAIHLPRICDAVFQDRLQAEFHKHYEDLRGQRNSVMHLTGRSPVQGLEIYKIILKSFKYLSPTESHSWFQERKRYSESDEHSVLGSDDSQWAIIREALRLIDYLGPAECIDLLGCRIRSQLPLRPCLIAPIRQIICTRYTSEFENGCRSRHLNCALVVVTPTC